MALKPWYNVVTPRQDLREGKPLDASEFAVHLDQVRDRRGSEDYYDPARFFDRTYLTHNLTQFAAEVVRRLSGEKTETSAVFNLTTQFGGGKTHALTLLYHLAHGGPAAERWTGVSKILAAAGIKGIPRAATAVFVGTEFDSLTGRGGNDGTPLRRTPWGEIAFQLGGAESFAVVAEHEAQFVEPKGDVIRAMLPKDRPCLILMDEIINYASTYRRKGYHNALYNFIQALSETARGQDNVVLVVSIPASELEYTSEDEQDEQRFKKMLDRVGKAVLMSAEAETSEIIRRRLFEWDPQAVAQDGRVILPRDAIETSLEFADWAVEHRQQVPNWFPVDHAREQFAATYPLHPLALSVFERKWQALPRFQRTRGILRLLALWVSRAYQEGFTGAQRDALIGLGTAPLDDPLFRAAVFEQLGTDKLEAAVTTDICGHADSFSTRLDEEAPEAIRKARLHRKVATTIFFESNGGQTHAEATMPEIRLAVAEPGLDIGNVETVLETLGTACYFLSVERNRYRFSLSPNLNKLLADRRANIPPDSVDERVREEIQKVFKQGSGIERVYFPVKSGQVSDRPVLTLCVLAPDNAVQDSLAGALAETIVREAGTSGRTYKSAVIFCAADSALQMQEEARKLLAWEAIESEAEDLRLDETQQRQLNENLKKAQRDLRESVWRAYKHLLLLGKDNKLHAKDLGLVHSSAADTMVQLILNRLLQDGDLVESVSPNFVTRNWPTAFKEWSTKAVRDAFFASPQFPRLLNGEAVKDTIARGASNGILAYVGKNGADYDPFVYQAQFGPREVELSEDMFIIRKEVAEQYRKAKEKPAQPPPGGPGGGTTPPVDQPTETTPPGQPATEGPPAESGTQLLRWTGDVPPQKWMNFYAKVLAKFAASKGLKLTLRVEVAPEGGLSSQKVEETKVALRELGLPDNVSTE